LPQDKEHPLTSYDQKLTNAQNEDKTNNSSLNTNKLAILAEMRKNNRLHFNWICKKSSEARGSYTQTKDGKIIRREPCGAVNYSYTDGGRTQRQCPHCLKWTRLNEGDMTFRSQHEAQNYAYRHSPRRRSE